MWDLILYTKWDTINTLHKMRHSAHNISTILGIFNLIIRSKLWSWSWLWLKIIYPSMRVFISE